VGNAKGRAREAGEGGRQKEVSCPPLQEKYSFSGVEGSIQKATVNSGRKQVVERKGGKEEGGRSCNRSKKKRPKRKGMLAILYVTASTESLEREKKGGREKEGEQTYSVAPGYGASQWVRGMKKKMEGIPERGQD